MKFLAKLVALAGIGLTTTAFAVDLSKVPDVRKASLSKLNKDEFMADRRPKFCTYAGEEQDNSPVCFDGVLSINEAHGYYANTNYRLGKPLTVNNKAKENIAGIKEISKYINSVYAGTEKAIKNNDPELNLVTAGLYNTFNKSIRNIEPYVLSIVNGNYNKEALDELNHFVNVFANGWQLSAPALIQYNGITKDKANNSTGYFRQEINKIRNILSLLNKYYQ